MADNGQPNTPQLRSSHEADREHAPEEPAVPLEVILQRVGEQVKAKCVGSDWSAQQFADALNTPVSEFIN